MKLDAALGLLKAKGYKYTGKRQQLLETFAKEDRYMPAKDVLAHMKMDYPSISFDTVYRNLSLFEDMGILESTELNGEKNYRFYCGDQGHHHHVICTVCGKTETIDFCPMKRVASVIDGFDISSHKFEVYGECVACKEGNTR